MWKVVLTPKLECIKLLMHIHTYMDIICRFISFLLFILLEEGECYKFTISMCIVHKSALSFYI